MKKKKSSMSLLPGQNLNKHEASQKMMKKMKRKFIISFKHFAMWLLYREKNNF